MAISAAAKYALNRMNSIAHKYQLGTLLDEAGSVAADEITLAEGKLLIGNGSGVAAAATLTSGQILVGNGSSVATPVSVTGDVTVSSSGVTAIAGGAVVNADVNASAAIDFSKLAALTSGNILVGNGSNVATSVAVSGVIALSNAGVTSFAAGVTYSHRLVTAGEHTTAGGDATETITATGAVATDLVLINVKTSGTGNRTVVAAAAGTDDITVTLSGDPTTDHVLQWFVFRAVS